MAPWPECHRQQCVVSNVPCPPRSQCEGDALLRWAELCSVLSSNRDLSSLYISQSVLSAAAVGILCEQASAASCQLKRLV